MKFSAQVQKILKAAKSYAERHNHEFLTPEHLLLQLISVKKIENLLESCGSNVSMVRESLYRYLDEKLPIIIAGETVESAGFQSVILSATEHCFFCEKEAIELEDLLISIYDCEKTHASYYLKSSGLQRLALISGISFSEYSEDEADENDTELESDALKENLSQSKEDDEKELNSFEDLLKYAEQKLLSIEELKNETEQLENAEKTKSDDEIINIDDVEITENAKPKNRKSVLERFTVNLTDRAKNGELDELIGRNEEIERALQVLCRQTKNNPLFVGAPGVGKTAIAYGIARNVAIQNVPDILKDCTVLELDVGRLIAGTKFRGELEERIKRISDELLRRKNVILFVDEIHTIIGYGSGQNGFSDGANLFADLVSSSDIRCMGATTYEEYSRYVEKNRALSRRFQKIDVEESSEEEAVKILKGVAPRFEKFHSVHYSDKALESAVKFSKQFMPNRFLPDKAIDIIDEAGAYLRLHPEENDAQDNVFIEEKLIEKITAKMVHIPEITVTVSEKDRLKNLEDVLKKNVIGQDFAVSTVVAAIKRSRAGFRDAQKPMGCFLFAGPTGVGKTELAKTLAENLQLKLHRFDMSEYQEKHTVSRLLGSPPGYVGFEEGGLLTEAVRREPNSLVLLDEIEKANPDIFNVLLQIMDYATLTDNQGRKADFRNVLLIMTSNAGARDVSKSLIGFGDRTIGSSAVNDAVEKLFTPEFRNRLDAVIPFEHLNKDIMISIVHKEIAKLSARLSDKNVKITVTDSCAEYLAEKGFSVEFGARNISRTIDEKISAVLVDEVLFGRLSNGGSVVCSEKDGKIVMRYGRKSKQ